MTHTYKIKATALLIGALAFSYQALGDSPHKHRHVPDKSTYIRVDVGGSGLDSRNRPDYDTKFKPSLVYAVGIGGSIRDRVRGDLTFSHRVRYSYNASQCTQTISSMALMLNGYYMVAETALAPYVMAGLGIAHNKAGDYYDHDSGASLQGRTINSFVWQAGGGLVYKFNNSIHTDLGYRYVSSNVAATHNKWVTPGGGTTEANSNKVRMRSHEFTLGLIYKL